jgi:TPP-dependent pyruvate/acetoin dehydrogenase alpha subunit
MRSKDFGTIPGVSKEFTEEQTLAMFRRICLVRAFDLNVKSAYDGGRIKCPVYLSFGEESVASARSVVYGKPFIFGQHRCHDLYIAFGGNLVALIDELLHRPTGCAKGMGGSASIHDQSIGMYGHSGLMGDQIPISVGFALGSGKRTLAVMGDASAEEDYVQSSMGYAAHKKLPILFVCMDNGLSILTKTQVRRSWSMADVARAFGMEAVEITDDPWLIMHHVKALADSSHPLFLNVHVVRHLWHAGTGNDGPPEWDRFALVKNELEKLGLGRAAEQIEAESKTYIDGLWEKQLMIERKVGELIS